MSAKKLPDQRICGTKGRDHRPTLDQMLKEAVRRRYDIRMVWLIDRSGRSVVHSGECAGRTRCRRHRSCPSAG